MKPSLAKKELDVAEFDAMSALDSIRRDWKNFAPSDAVVPALAEIVCTAGDLALGFFRPGAKTSAAISKKAGGSPVTEADHAVNRYLEDKLRALLPEAGWLSEESPDNDERINQDLVFIVDPIDGTRAFAAGERSWAVSVAVAYRKRPVIGIVHAPALGETYLAVKNGGAQLNGASISCSSRLGLDASALVGGPLSMAAELRGLGLQFDLIPKIPSLALRIAKVASGMLDAALVSVNSNDWDIAAADLIVNEAGGRMTTLYGRELLYNKSSTKHGELIVGPQPILAQISGAMIEARGA